MPEETDEERRRRIIIIITGAGEALKRFWEWMTGPFRG